LIMKKSTWKIKKGDEIITSGDENIWLLTAIERDEILKDL